MKFYKFNTEFSLKNSENLIIDMMKFILQDSKLIRDFENELLWSESYWNWANSSKPENLKTKIKVIRERDIRKETDLKEICPVGSVEFVLNWLSNIHGKTPSPINVPEVLITNDCLRNCGREIVNIGDFNNYNAPKTFKNKKLYVKSNDIIKFESNGIYDYEDLGKSITGNLQVSTIIQNIISESRVFVYKDNVVGLKTYCGDPFVTPNKDDVYRLVDLYKKVSPISYTLDIVNVIDENGLVNSYVLEVHDFFSCGLYGFSDYRRYPFMLFRWFKNFINNENSK